MQSTSIMEMLTTPTTFPLNINWEGKMEPSSPLDSQHDLAEDIIFDDSYDYCKEPLFNHEVDFDEDLKPDLSTLSKDFLGNLSTTSLMKDFLENSQIVVELPQQDLCYDDKLKISSNDESVQLGNYGPPSTAGEDEFYHFSQPSEAKTTGCTNGPELLMEFDCVSSNMELMNHLTPPQTPPQTTSFGGVVGCVLPIQTPMNCLPASQQQQQEQPQEQFHPLFVSQFNGQGMLQQEQQVSYQATNDNTILNGYYITDDFSTVSSQIGNGGVQQQTVTLEAAPQVSGDIDATLFNFVENYTAQQVENILLGLQREPNRGTDDDESCDFSEIGSFENGGSLSPASLTSSVVGQSPAYSDSAESSAYYASSRNDGDDEDWSPSKVKKLNGRNGGAVTKKRSGPNGTTNSRGRGIEDKKSRKKEQNKNAATRYRQKKKAEIEEILVVEEQLRAENEKLRKESKDLGRDIRCIKNLLRDFLKSKI